MLTNNWAQKYWYLPLKNLYQSNLGSYIHTYTYTAVGTYCGGRGWGRFGLTIDWEISCKFLINLDLFWSVDKGGIFHVLRQIAFWEKSYSVIPLSDCAIKLQTDWLNGDVGAWVLAGSVHLSNVLKEISEVDRRVAVRGPGGVRSSSQAEVKGQIGLAHLLPVHRVKLFVHRHCEDVLPQTHATCRQDAQGERRILNINKRFSYFSTQPDVYLSNDSEHGGGPAASFCPLAPQQFNPTMILSFTLSFDCDLNLVSFQSHLHVHMTHHQKWITCLICHGSHKTVMP